MPKTEPTPKRVECEEGRGLRRGVHIQPTRGCTIYYASWFRRCPSGTLRLFTLVPSGPKELTDRLSHWFLRGRKTVRIVIHAAPFGTDGQDSDMPITNPAASSISAHRRRNATSRRQRFHTSTSPSSPLPIARLRGLPTSRIPSPAPMDIAARAMKKNSLEVVSQ